MGLLLTGCCYIRNERTQVVQLTSSPPGAIAQIQPGGQEVVTPAALSLERKTQYYVITFKKDGYEPTQAKLVRKSEGFWWRNLVWVHPAGWLAGVLVDSLTGAGYSVQPQNVQVNLAPAQPASVPQKTASAASPSS